MIGEKFQKLVGEAFSELLAKHLPSIKEAFINSEAGIVVSVPIKIRPNQKKNGFIDVEVGIRFVRLKTKDSTLLEISEAQNPLFKAVEKLRPKNGSEIDSVKITHHPSGESVELRAKD